MQHADGDSAAAPGQCNPENVADAVVVDELPQLFHRRWRPLLLDKLQNYIRPCPFNLISELVL